MSDQNPQILFVCTHNSGRSILAEALLNARAQGLARAWSAGSQPSGRVNPLALQALARRGVPTEGLHSKNWDAFAEPGSPTFDLVITLCDSAAGEACPLWPGTPMRQHWGLPDPAGTPGGEAEKAAAFVATADRLQARIDRLLALLPLLPMRRLDPAILQHRFDELAQD